MKKYYLNRRRIWIAYGVPRPIPPMRDTAAHEWGTQAVALRLLGFVAFAEFGYYLEVFEGGGVAFDFAAGG